MLELKNICYTVSTPETGEQTILKDISVTIPDGKLIVFTGPNGGGKTTLAKVIMGLVTPTRRSDPLERRGHHRPRHHGAREARISYGFQQPPRFKGITVRDLLTIASGDSKLSKDKCWPLPHAGRPMRERLSRPRSGRLPLGRRGQAHRDRDAARASFRADDLRRARGRYRPVELRPSDRDL